VGLKKMKYTPRAISIASSVRMLPVLKYTLPGNRNLWLSSPPPDNAPYYYQDKWEQTDARYVEES